MTVKRWGAVLVALGFLFSLFGCSRTVDHGSWTSLIVSNLSPDRRDSYSFRVTVSEDGGMILYGYCNDDENEYRSDEGIALTSQTADRLREMEIETLSTYKIKQKSGLFYVPDDVERIAQITYEDGAEFAVSLSNELRAEIVSLLEGELMAAVLAEIHGEWNRLYLSFRNDCYSEWYDFEVRMNDNGDWIAVGYCSDVEYNRYESDDGIVLSEQTMTAIRALQPERYPAVRNAGPDPETDDVMILDGSSGGLFLGYADGYTEEKATPGTLDDMIAELLKQEFTKKAAPQ
ncbi:MAG: hypothetical protein E7662_13330 [Ruminococcaceae bacterium]|nr:hypothetical protein [Oscillospiraceae bacterium]